MLGGQGTDAVSEGILNALSVPLDLDIYLSGFFRNPDNANTYTKRSLGFLKLGGALLTTGLKVNTILKEDGLELGEY